MSKGRFNPAGVDLDQYALRDIADGVQTGRGKTWILRGTDSSTGLTIQVIITEPGSRLTGWSKADQLVDWLSEQLRKESGPGKFEYRNIPTRGRDFLGENGFLSGLLRSRRRASEIPATVKEWARTLPPSRETADIAKQDDLRAALRSRLMEEFELLTADQVADLTNSVAANRSQRATQWAREKRIFSIHTGRRRLYPRFQFADFQPRPIIADVLKIWGGQVSDWDAFAWFGTAEYWACEGVPPATLLDTAPKTVLKAAEHVVDGAWY